MDINGTAAGHFEPSVSVQFLPRCAACGDRHPLAYAPPRKTDRCPRCDAPSAPPGQAFDAAAVIAGQTIAARTARLCFRVAASLRRLADRLEN